MNSLLGAAAFLGLVASAQSIDPVARDAIRKAQQLQASSRAFTVATRTIMAAGSTTSKMIYVAPDRYHAMDTSGVLLAQIIRVGNRGWMKTGEGPWEPAVFDTSNYLRSHTGPPAIESPGYRLVEARRLPGSSADAIKLYSYVVSRDDQTWRVQVSVLEATGHPVKYEADIQRGADKERQTWEITYDDALSVKEPAIAAAPAAECGTAAACLALGRARAKAGDRAGASGFYKMACDAGTWEGCFGYSTHLLGVGMSAKTDADRINAIDEGLAFMDRALEARPNYWRAHLFRSLLLRGKHDLTLLSEADVASARAKALLAETQDRSAGEEDVLWQPDPPPPPKPPVEWSVRDAAGSSSRTPSLAPQETPEDTSRGRLSLPTSAASR